MRIQEAARAAGLTKKALAYYEEAGLVHPLVETNGYRDYTSEDVDRLMRVAVLRQCGLSVAEIRSALDGGSLAECASRKREALLESAERLEVLEALACNEDWEAARGRLAALSQRQSVLERMEACFPGFYGRYLRAHFGPFLRCKIETAEQQEAMETVISFWDHLDIPSELQAACGALEAGQDADALSQSLRDAAKDPDAFVSSHQATLKWYAQYRQSEAFLQSPAYRLKETLDALYRQSGYYDVFLPAMERLSPDYAAYRQMLREASTRFSALL